MKISLITVTFNSEKTIENTLKSVFSQNYANLEYIIIDGNSIDKTKQIIEKYKSGISIYISEHDNGMYHAINKGLTLATGDIIGILNSDDQFYNNNVLKHISEKFYYNKKLDAIIGNVVFTNKNGKIKRKITIKNWNKNMFAWGFMPPHPAFYCKKEVFNNYGLYRTDYLIASDYEFLIRVLYTYNINFIKLNSILVTMSLGGKSTKSLYSNFKINQEILKSCKIHNIKTNYFKLYIKYLIKIFQIKFF
jgi:glycosyltransferase involved in cell wall biosynthesis